MVPPDSPPGTRCLIFQPLPQPTVPQSIQCLFCPAAHVRPAHQGHVRQTSQKRLVISVPTDTENGVADHVRAIAVNCLIPRGGVRPLQFYKVALIEPQDTARHFHLQAEALVRDRVRRLCPLVVYESAGDVVHHPVPVYSQGLICRFLQSDTVNPHCGGRHIPFHPGGKLLRCAPVPGGLPGPGKGTDGKYHHSRRQNPRSGPPGGGPGHQGCNALLQVRAAHGGGTAHQAAAPLCQTHQGAAIGRPLRLPQALHRRLITGQLTVPAAEGRRPPHQRVVPVEH